MSIVVGHHYAENIKMEERQVPFSFEVPITTPMFPHTHLIEYQEQKIKLIVEHKFNLDFFPWVALEFLCLWGGACLGCVLSPMGKFCFAKNNKKCWPEYHLCSYKFLIKQNKEKFALKSKHHAQLIYLLVQNINLTICFQNWQYASLCSCVSHYDRFLQLALNPQKIKSIIKYSAAKLNKLKVNQDYQAGFHIEKKSSP